jgi:methylmalonyl-CoA mutase
MVRHLLAAGGMATAFADSIDDAETAVAAFAASGSSTAILCSSPQSAELIPEFARSLKDRGARRVLAASPPGEHESMWRSAGVDGLMYDGCDAVKMLGDLLETEAVRRG